MRLSEVSQADVYLFSARQQESMWLSNKAMMCFTLVKHNYNFEKEQESSAQPKISFKLSSYLGWCHYSGWKLPIEEQDWVIILWHVLVFSSASIHLKKAWEQFQRPFNCWFEVISMTEIEISMRLSDKAMIFLPCQAQVLSWMQHGSNTKIMQLPEYSF